MAGQSKGGVGVVAGEANSGGGGGGPALFGPSDTRTGDGGALAMCSRHHRGSLSLGPC